MKVYTSKQETIELAKKPFASGGEGAIYKVISSPSHLQDVCVKIYHAHIVNQQREERIKYMAANPPSQVRGEGFLLGWPLEYVTDDTGKFLGFVMPLGFPDSKELVTLTATTLSRKLGQEWQDRYDRSLGKKALLNRLKLICNIAIPVHLLHSTGRYVLRDFKPQNVLATADGRITICDMDSIQIAEGDRLLFPGTAATAEYIPPECYTRGVGRNASDIIKPSWDSFAVGTVFYQLLMGIHPYVVTPRQESGDGSNDISQNIASCLFPFGVKGDEVKVRPKLHDRFMLLPDELQDLFMRTFGEDTKDRPSAEEWGQYIHQMVINTPKDEIEEENPTAPEEEQATTNKTDLSSSSQNNTTNSTPIGNPPEEKPKLYKIWWRALGLGILALIFAMLSVYMWDNEAKQPAEEASYEIEEAVTIDSAEAAAEEAVASDSSAVAVEEDTGQQSIIKLEDGWYYVCVMQSWDLSNAKSVLNQLRNMGYAAQLVDLGYDSFYGCSTYTICVKKSQSLSVVQEFVWSFENPTDYSDYVFYGEELVGGYDDLIELEH